MQNPTYIPNKQADRNAWIANFDTLLTAAPGDYGSTPPEAVAVSAVVAPYQAAYATAIAPSTRTPAAIAAKDQLEAAALAVIRPLATQISANLAVTSEAKTAIGVTVRSSGRSPVSAPTVAPTLVLDGQTPGVANLRYGNAENPDSKAAPFGCVGVDLDVGYGATPEAAASALAYVGRFTKSPLRLDVQGQSGRHCAVRVRWATRNGLQGVAQYSPYSPAVTFVVG